MRGARTSGRTGGRDRAGYRIEDKSWDFSAPAVSFVLGNIVHGFDVEPDADATVISIADDMLKVMARKLQLSLDMPVFVAGESDS